MTSRLCAWCAKLYTRLAPHGHWCCVDCFDKWKEEYE